MFKIPVYSNPSCMALIRTRGFINPCSAFNNAHCSNRWGDAKLQNGLKFLSVRAQCRERGTAWGADDPDFMPLPIMRIRMPNAFALQKRNQPSGFSALDSGLGPFIDH